MKYWKLFQLYIVYFVLGIKNIKDDVKRVFIYENIHEYFGLKKQGKCGASLVTIIST